MTNIRQIREDLRQNKPGAHLLMLDHLLDALSDIHDQIELHREHSENYLKNSLKPYGLYPLHLYINPGSHAVVRFFGLKWKLDLKMLATTDIDSVYRIMKHEAKERFRNYSVPNDVFHAIAMGFETSDIVPGWLTADKWRSLLVGYGVGKKYLLSDNLSSEHSKNYNIYRYLRGTLGLAINMASTAASSWAALPKMNPEQEENLIKEIGDVCRIVTIPDF